MTRRPRTRSNRLAAGVLAGLAGSSALNAVTYLDMAVRARPASTTPEETARRITQVAGIGLGPEARAANRRSGLGPLLGYLAAVGTAVAFTALVGDRRPALPAAAVGLGAAAMLAADVPMTLLGVTDPRRWSIVDWLSDLIPHATYGAVAAMTLRALRPG